MKKFFKEFKDFITRGNVLDMAVGIIVGSAFTAIVTSLTANFLNPLLSLIFNGNVGTMPDSEAAWTAGAAATNFVNAIITFILTAFVLFCIVKAINKVASATKKPEAPKEPTTKECPFCFSTISIKATRCPCCTAELPVEKK